MERQVTFHTSLFGGFNKKSVLQYIDEMCGQNESSLQELNNKIAELQTNNDGFTGTITQMGAELQTLRDEAMQKGVEVIERSSVLQQTIRDLNAEIDHQQRLMDDKDREIKIQQEKCRQLLLRAESLEYKGRKYDDSMALIGGAIIEAQKSAEGIIKAAEHKASRLTITTMESIQSLAGEIRTFKGDISTLRSTLQQSMEDLEQRLDSIDNSLDTIDAAVKATGVAKTEGESCSSPAVQEKIPEILPYAKAKLTGEQADEYPTVEQFFDAGAKPSRPQPEITWASGVSEVVGKETETCWQERLAEQEVREESKQEEEPAAQPREFFW